MSPLFYAVGASGIGYKTFAAAKVQLFFEICKKMSEKVRRKLILRQNTIL